METFWHSSWILDAGQRHKKLEIDNEIVSLKSFDPAGFLKMLDRVVQHSRIKSRKEFVPFQSVFGDKVPVLLTSCD